MAVNWDQLNQPGAFERAFDSGFQLAEYGRQRREQTDQRNALSAYATDPNDQNFNALAQHLPEYAIQVRGQRDQARQREQQAGYEGIQQFRPVLEQAMQSPQAWQQARTALAQSGHDISDVPEQFDPNWAQGQLMILNAADDGSLPGIVQEFQAAGIDVDTPTGQQALRDALEGKYGSEYTDQQGNVRRRRLFNLPPVGEQQTTQAPQSATVPSGSPLSPPAPQQAQQPQMRITPREYQALIQRYGPQAVQERLTGGSAIVAVQTPDEARTLPSGTPILLPDGSEGRVP